MEDPYVEIARYRFQIYISHRPTRARRARHERADAGAPSLDHCICVPGFGDNGAGGCALCPNATFSAGGDEDGNRHPACVDCPAHRNSSRGSTLITDCLCVPGYGAGPGACVPCADGLYSVGGHNNSCTSCGWGAISEPPLAATTFDACLCNAAIGVYELTYELTSS